MINLITGLIAVVALVVFLGNYALTIKSLPLWVIVVGVLMLPAADYLLSVRATRRLSRDTDPGS